MNTDGFKKSKFSYSYGFIQNEILKPSLIITIYFTDHIKNNFTSKIV